MCVCVCVCVLWGLLHVSLCCGIGCLTQVLVELKWVAWGVVGMQHFQGSIHMSTCVLCGGGGDATFLRSINMSTCVLCG
jgi:hypothetical protein